jgi:uncharacterized membrane protein
VTLRRWVVWAVTALSFAGFVIATYLTFVHVRGYVSPCYIVQGCEAVQTSEYSVVLGVPVALAGAVFFALMFYLGVGLLTATRLWVLRAVQVLAFVAALAMIPLFFLQAIVLKAFCSYCLATEAIVLAMWVLTFLLVPAARRERAAAD